MKIYEMRIAPNPRRVRIFLAEKQIDNIEYVELDLQKGENLSEEFKRKNMMKKVPVLELDDGQCISESVAICRYFEEIKPAPSLFGESPIEKATVEMWQRWAEFYFMMPTGMCFQHSSGYFKDRMTPVPEWGAECRKQVLGFLAKLDQHLGDSEYLAGDKYSIADITAMCTMDFNKVNRITIADDQKNLQRWYQSVSSRPSASA